MDRETQDAQILDRYTSQYRVLTARLAQIGFIWSGSIQKQWIKCGKPGCACSKDPRGRHGPYVYWTSKKEGRTVTHLLHSSEAHILSEWVGNRREVERVLQQMSEVSHKSLKAAIRMRQRESNR